MAARPKWVDVLCALDGVAAALSLIVGVYLLNPTTIDLGWYVEPGRYAIAGWFLIYNAVLLLYAAVFGARPRSRVALIRIAFFPVSPLALTAIGTLELILAFQALFAVDPPRYWVALLAIPGLLAVLSSPLPMLAEAARRRAEPKGADEVSAQSGKSTPGGAVAAYVGAGAVTALVVAVVAAIFGALLFVYQALHVSLVEDIEIDVAYLVEVHIPRLLEKIWPWVFGFGLSLLVMVSLVGVVIALSQRLSRRRLPDIDRDLSADEVGFVTRCVGDLDEYIARNGYRELAARMSRFDGAWFLSLFVAMVGFIFLAETIIAALYDPASTSGVWDLYVVDSVSAPLMAIVLAAAWVFAPAVVTSLVSRRFAEARTLAHKGAIRSIAPLQDLIVEAVRRRALSSSQGFDAGSFLKRLNSTARVSSAVWILLATGVALGAWPHDRATDTLYTGNGIETGDFVSLQRVTYAYPAVQSVDLECWFDSSGSTDIDYTLNLPDEQRRRLFSKRSLGARIDDYLRVDALLRAAHVRFEFATAFEAASGAQILDRECVLALARDRGIDRAKLEQLFHMDEWHERRWKQRISSPLISSN